MVAWAVTGCTDMMGICVCGVDITGTWGVVDIETVGRPMDVGGEGWDVIGDDSDAELVVVPRNML